MAEKKGKSSSSILMILHRLVIIVSAIGVFIPMFNPARLSGAISKNASFFTCATSYSTIGSNFVRALSRDWIDQKTLTMTYVATLIAIIGVVLIIAGGCMSLGEIKFKRLGTKVSIIGSIVGLIGMVIYFPAHLGFAATSNPDRIEPMFATGIWIYIVLFLATLLLALVLIFTLPKHTENDKYEMVSKYKLFLMIIPFVVLVIVFSYLPLWGWRYSFFDYKPGSELTKDTFVGFKWFKFLFNNAATRADIYRVIKNTLGLSGIGIATSWLPMVFAIFLSEITANKTRRLVQTFTTIPNFISWVLVYTVAFALFSTEGFVNSMLIDLGIIDVGTNFLMSGEHIWLKMWAWGTWKGLGWGAIIYLAAISGIDQQLYEAATVDGAGRFKKMWHITVPGLIPTYCVLLLMSVASILSNGMDQYLVFKNAMNKDTIEVLDLYVYTLGIGSGGNIPLATLVGMLKSVISVVLLFAANKISAVIRGNSIV